jgi:hypothetical protein
MAMKYSTLHKPALLLSTAAIAAGCSGPGTFQQAYTPPAAAHARLAKSWAAAGLGPQNLLYVSNANGFVNIYRYWQKNLVGVLTNFSNPMGMCVDNNRNVYIADFGAKTIVEYAHGGSTPIRTIDTAPYAPYVCSVDATTGDLAVGSFRKTKNWSDGSIAIYKHAQGTPTIYKGQNISHFTALSYDDSGDLLASAYYQQYVTFYAGFYYLPKHGTHIFLMHLPNSQFTESGYSWPPVQSINYDGTYWVVTAYDTMYRYTIGVKAVEVDYMELTGASQAGELWFYRATRHAQATQVVAGDGTYNDTNTVNFWKYPVSANPIATISSGLDAPYGVTVSLKTSK